MNAATERLTLAGAAGAIEALRDSVSGGAVAVGTAVIAHPHPLFGGTMDNKVVQTLARAFVQCRWNAVRFNFRGVGSSAGTHDEGRGESEDYLAVLAAMAPTGPVALAGFSFGTLVVSRAVQALAPSREPDLRKVVLVAPAAARFDVAALEPGFHERTLVVHGEQDDTVPLSAAMDWARPQSLPITVVPGGGHFFHGQLPLLKGLVMRHLHA